MKYVEVIADACNAETVSAIAEQVKAQDFRLGTIGEDGMQQMRLLISDKRLQQALDALQQILGPESNARVLVMPIEAYLPKPDTDAEQKAANAASTREAMYLQVEKGAYIDTNFILLVILATAVAAIGMIENNVAVVIGAMVIAPLLGPNLALSLGTALGDAKLMRTSIQALALGILIAVGLSVLTGWLWPGALNSPELLSRTNASLDSIVLALASGSAATLSLTSGLSGVLVGVMVSVALLPPAVALGLMLGAGELHLAAGAGLLLAINIVCVNLASKLVFLVKGISPRTWLEKENAKNAMIRNLIGWILSLIALLIFIALRN